MTEILRFEYQVTQRRTHYCFEFAEVVKFVKWRAGEKYQVLQ